MNKKDIHVGESYAVSLHPINWDGWRGTMATALEAKVVDLNGVISKTINRVVFNDINAEGVKQWKVNEDTLVESGIIVDLAVPITRTVNKYKYNGYSPGTPGENGFPSDFGETEEITITRVALKNGRCFRSTWAEYGADVVEKSLTKEIDAIVWQTRREAVSAQSEAKNHQLTRVLEHLSNVTGAPIVSTYNGYAVGGFKITTLHENGADGQNHLVGATINVGLNSFALLSGISHVDSVDAIKDDALEANETYKDLKNQRGY
jgi:hypothetical protein